MKVSAEDLSPIEKRLHVELDPVRVEKELDRAYKARSRQVSIPGFRAGKIPRRILEQRFRGEVEAEARQRLIEESLSQALADIGVVPVAPPQLLQLDSLKIGEPFRYHAKIEVKPVVEVKEYRGLPLVPRAPKVSDADVDAEIEHLRAAAAQLVPVTDRDRVMTGDFAVVDYAAAVDGKPLPGLRGENKTFEVAEGESLGGLAAGLAGARVGETRELPQTFGANYAQAPLRGKTAKVTFHVRGIKRREAPALDDEFAKDLGAKGLLDLKDRVRGQLVERTKADADRDERDQLVRALADRNPFDVPNAMVERALNQILQAGAARLLRQGIDLNRAEAEVDRLRKELWPAALFEVRAALLLEAVANQEGIAVADADVAERLSEIARQAKQPVEKVRAQVGAEAVKNRLVEERVVAVLRAAATLPQARTAGA